MHVILPCFRSHTSVALETKQFAKIDKAFHHGWPRISKLNRLFENSTLRLKTKTLRLKTKLLRLKTELHV